MHVVVRRYRGAGQLLDELAKNQADIERLLRDIQGFVAYYLVRSGDNGFSVTVCQDRIGTEESSRLAATWITDNAPNLPGNDPEVTEGEAVVQVRM